MTMREPVLYILMRTDMKSMNPGKGMAQAAHAQAAFTWKITHTEHLPQNVDFGYQRWCEQTPQRFGTTIVLDGGDEKYMLHIIDVVKQLDNVVAGVVHDPSYPVRDGRAMHHTPCNTCAFVFLDQAEGVGPLDSLGLYR